VSIDIGVVAAAAELDALEPLWIALHRHHRTVVPAVAMLVDDDAASWTRRRALYRDWLATGDALVLVARRAGTPVGYAVARLRDGPDDTFAVGARYAELYSRQRGRTAVLPPPRPRPGRTGAVAHPGWTAVSLRRGSP
jgi:hypothetical protein